MAILDLDRPRLVRAPGRTLLALALLAGVVVGARGITSETSVSLQGDMARYLMDGVFLKDLLVSGSVWSPHDLLQYAQHYYARYPALSIGHHPPLLPATLVPFFAVLGVSIAAARLDILAFFLLAVVLLYTLVRRLYDDTTAGWACLLFASNPFVAWYGQRVLSEMPAIALVLASMNFAIRFRDRGAVRDYFLLVAMAILSLAARQLAVFVFPAYVFALFQNGGWRRLKQPTILFWTAVGGVVIAVIAVATLALAPFNVSIVRAMFVNGVGPSKALGVLATIVRQQLQPALLWVSAAGVAAALVTRDRRLVVVLVWIASVLVSVITLTGTVEPARYSAFAVPAYCIAGATLWARSRRDRVRLACGVILTLTIGWQFVAGRTVRPSGASGYEQAAEFVLGDPSSPTVLFSGSVDTGYFVFFVRKHDPAMRLVVLRSDKILTTSLMGKLAVENRISNPEQIYGILKRYGTRYIVIEDHPTGSVVLDWLRDQLRTSQFAERRRFPIASRNPHLSDVDLVVYEYLDATPPDPTAQLDLRLPVVGREIRVPLSDLIAGPAGR